jgi:hypothetical protein
MQSRAHAHGAAHLRQIAFGMRASQALYVAAKLGVADHLAQKPMTGGELAAATHVDAGALNRVMRALCALDVFAESTTGEFSLNESGKLLRSDIAGSYRAAVLFMAGDVRWRCWSDLLGAVRTGEGGTERALGVSLFDFYAGNPEQSEIHDQAMRGISAAHVTAVLGAMDFSSAGVVVDVGGGTGELLAAILAANPNLRGVLFDLPHVVAHAVTAHGDRHVADRMQRVEGSFFDAVPAGGDTYLLKAIIHDWDDARATVILRNCRSVVRPGSRLLLIDRELPEPGQPGRTAEAFLLDLEMLVMTPGGRERTRGEFAKLLAGAGFQLTRTVPTGAPVSIFEAIPV